MKMTVANILTLSRLVLAPIFAVVLLMGNLGLALVLFMIAGFTDLIDGTIARVLKQHSRGGALLDPLADKTLVQTCFLLLAIIGVIPWWFALLSLCRDIMIVSGIFYLEHIRATLPYRASIASKCATFVQLLVAIAGLVSRWRPETVIAGLSIETLLTGCIVVAAILIVISGGQYIAQGIGILREHRLKQVSTSS